MIKEIASAIIRGTLTTKLLFPNLFKKKKDEEEETLPESFQPTTIQNEQRTSEGSFPQGRTYGQRATNPTIPSHPIHTQMGPPPPKRKNQVQFFLNSNVHHEPKRPVLKNEEYEEEECEEEENMTEEMIYEQEEVLHEFENKETIQYDEAPEIWMTQEEFEKSILKKNVTSELPLPRKEEIVPQKEEIFEDSENEEEEEKMESNTTPLLCQLKNSQLYFILHVQDPTWIKQKIMEHQDQKITISNRNEIVFMDETENGLLFGSQCQQKYVGILEFLEEQNPQIENSYFNLV